jgi:hypothetical protein
MGYRPSTLPQTGVLVTINQEATVMRMVLGGIATARLIAGKDPEATDRHPQAQHPRRARPRLVRDQGRGGVDLQA